MSAVGLTKNATVFCPRDGSIWYACDSGSRFVGCCKLKPCETGCAEGYISPALMAADDTGQLPDPACPIGANSYTCSIRGLAFFGCCASNACNPGGCPPSDVRSAFLEQPHELETFLRASQPPLPEISAGLVADGPPKILPVPHKGSENGHLPAWIVVGLCMGLLLILPIVLGIWICVRHRFGDERDHSKSAEWYFPFLRP
ncbi:hypothetical protein IAQ61_006169 [Plenodomus lingam]|uniref:uncharacterized protein n=1 Tax=Leptosphaeria maculans TaxID=5022 RepID=UPI0033317DE4|nr:hypothetical protein IAQ61_006169 [Plenodomus lingam]